MKEVVLCFLDIESNMLRSSWLNSWAAKLAPTSRHKRPPQVHVELFFRDGNSDEGHCTSIVYNKKIHWFRKSSQGSGVFEVFGWKITFMQN